MKKPINELLDFSIINLDKPCNYTSFQAAEIVGKMLKELGVKKFSHFGTLDPLVSGVLPVALNRACKLTTWFMKKNKTYVGIIKLHKEIEEDKLKEEMQKFVGKIMQLPPVKSRVKRQERERSVYSWDILEYGKEKKEVLFLCEVEAGTYIRKLISDLGIKIGGSHMAELRRTKAGIFSEENEGFVNLYQLEEAVKEYKSGKEEKLRQILIPGELAIKKIMPSIEAKEEKIKELLRGKPIFADDLIGGIGKIKENDIFAIFCKDKLIGVYKKIYEGEIIARSEWVFN